MNHKKDFDKWNKKKKETDSQIVRVFFHEREVWWGKLGANVGFEEDGKGDFFGRPILVFKKFNNELLWGIPLSTKIKTGKYYAKISLGDGIERVALLSQMKPLDAKRLYQRIGFASIADFDQIEARIIALCKERR